MRVIEPSFEFLHFPETSSALAHLELAARTCYKSEDKIKEGSAEGLIGRIVRMGHESVLEHVGVSARITCDRGVSHELVRHRLCSFSQESTRYANYSRDKFGKEIVVIRPSFWAEGSDKYALWVKAMEAAERSYLELVEMGASAQEARSILPNSLKTEVVTTCNLREWRHIFKLRCAPASHPQMRQVALPMLAEFNKRLPLVFADLYAKFEEDITSFPEQAALTE
ncbi:MAG: FAD-dependent thymidylate synthase [Desulfovibrio sp.]